MTSCWQPLLPIRWHRKEDGTLVLQQAWGKRVQSSDDGRWYSEPEHRWEDVPTDINDPTYWSKDD